MVGRNTAMQATKGDGAPGGRPVLAAALGPKTKAVDAEVESIFASLAELFDEPSPAQPAMVHDAPFGKAATQTGTRPRVTRPAVGLVPRVALPKAHEDDPDLDQSQTVRIEHPVIPTQALRSNPPAAPPAQPETSQGQPARPAPVAPAQVAKAGPLPLAVSAPAIPALPKVLVPPRPSPRPRAPSAEPGACSPEDVTLISARPPALKLEAAAKLAPSVVLITPADVARKAAAAAPSLPTVPHAAPGASAAPSKVTVRPAPGPRSRAWIAVVAAMGVMVLGFAGWRGALALRPAVAPATPPEETIPETAPTLEIAPEPTSLVAEPAPAASPAPDETVAPPPQRPPFLAAALAPGRFHARASSGAPLSAPRKTATKAALPPAPKAEPVPTVTPKAAPRVSGPLIPLEEDAR